MRHRTWWLVGVVALFAASCAKGETDPRDDDSGLGLGDGEETEEGPGQENTGDCTEDQLACGSGECIAAKYACDLKAQCVDGSDEWPNNPTCPEPSCQTGQYMCPGGQCIPGEYQCDGIADCADSSDEDVSVCGAPPACTADQWQCLSGECIPAYYYCDTIVDCADSSDESSC
jgi:hypothetical protein